MNSKVYTGQIEHTRYFPKEHQFRYPLLVYGIDLDEPADIDKRVIPFGYNRFRPASLYDKDYGFTKEGNIKEKLLGLLKQEGVSETVEKVFLITSARYFNYVFNPVSFYYCFSGDGSLCSVVAEVNNTYGERHMYLLRDTVETPEGYLAAYETDKAFHVSPFNNLKGRYRFFLGPIEKGLDIRIELIREDQTVFDAHLSAEAIELTSWNLIKLMVKNPILPHKSIPRIYWQAMKLYFQKRLEFNDKPEPISRMTVPNKKPGLFERFCKQIVFSQLKRFSEGRLTVELPDGKKRAFGDPVIYTDQRPGVIRVKDYRFFSRLVFGGEIGFGEAYMANDWGSPDLQAVFDVIIKNRDRVGDGNWATAFLTKIRERSFHLKNKNTFSGSKKNIGDHYDLGNDFYQLFLDPTMLYSCGIFRSGDESLEDAQQNKLDHIIDKAKIGPTDHVLEIGCGWGGFAIEAAGKTGCRVTGITISEEQYQFATERIRQEGLEDRVTILLEDYRNIEGRYDRIVSIEMLEAVGEDFISVFFQTCDKLLKPDGLMVVQVITIPDQRYDVYRKETDWIQKHIFPGGHLPSLTALCRQMTKHSSFMAEHVENIGYDYARTISFWKENFIAEKDRLLQMGFDEAFYRKWVYYFSICEAGFRNRVLGDLQILFTRQQNQRLNAY